MPGFPHSLLYRGGIERSHVIPPSYLPVSGSLVWSAKPGWVYSMIWVKILRKSKKKNPVLLFRQCNSCLLLHTNYAQKKCVRPEIELLRGRDLGATEVVTGAWDNSFS